MADRRDGEALEATAERVMRDEPDYQVTVTLGFLLRASRRGTCGTLGETSSEGLLLHMIGADRERRSAQAGAAT